MPKRSRLLGRVLHKNKPRQIVFFTLDEDERQRIQAKAKAAGVSIGFIREFADSMVEKAITLGGMVTYHDELPEELAVHVCEDGKQRLRRFR